MSIRLVHHGRGDLGAIVGGVASICQLEAHTTEAGCA